MGFPFPNLPSLSFLNHNISAVAKENYAYLKNINKDNTLYYLCLFF